MDILSGVPVSVFSAVSSNEAQSLPVEDDEVFGLVGGENEVLIKIETKSVRFGFGGVAPTQGEGRRGIVVEPGGTLRVGSPSALRTLQFISAVEDEHGILQVVGIVN